MIEIGLTGWNRHDSLPTGGIKDKFRAYSVAPNAKELMQLLGIEYESDVQGQLNLFDL